MASIKDVRISITPNESNELFPVAFLASGASIHGGHTSRIINVKKYQLFIEFPVTFLNVLKNVECIKSIPFF
jgi:hypothetical protein